MSWSADTSAAVDDETVDSDSDGRSELARDAEDAPCNGRPIFRP